MKLETKHPKWSENDRYRDYPVASNIDVLKNILTAKNLLHLQHNALWSDDDRTFLSLFDTTGYQNQINLRSYQQYKVIWNSVMQYRANGEWFRKEKRVVDVIWDRVFFVLIADEKGKDFYLMQGVVGIVSFNLWGVSDNHQYPWTSTLCFRGYQDVLKYCGMVFYRWTNYHGFVLLFSIDYYFFQTFSVWMKKAIR